MRFLIVLLLCLGAWRNVTTTFAQPHANVEVDRAVREWQDRSQGSNDYLIDQGNRLRAAGLATGNCDTLRIAHALLMHAFTDDPEALELPELDTLLCPIEGFELMREIGVYEFLFGDLDRARHWFEKCLPLTEVPKERASLSQNIGTCYYLNNELEDAVHWYELSTEYGMELLSAISIMNLASVSMALGDATNGLKWAEAAEARLIQQLDEGLDAETFVRQRDLILLNHSLAHLELGQMDEAMDAYDRLKLDGFLPGVSMEFYHLAVALAFAIDSPLPIERHQVAFSEHIVQDSVGAVARFGPTLLMLEPWKSRWTEAESPWEVIRALPKDQLPQLIDPGRMADASKATGNARGALLALIWLVVGVASFAWVRRQQPRTAAGTAELLTKVRSALLDGNAKACRRSLAELLHAEDLAPLDLNVSLTARETEVLIGIKDGERAKETAQRLDLSVKSIYMMRSELKRKLQLSDNDSIEAWVNKQTPKA